MMSRFPSFASVSSVKGALIIGALAAATTVAWTGCGPGSEARYYCDSTGCFTCDAYGCTNVAPPEKAACTGNTSCPAGMICTASGCTTTCSEDAQCPRGEVCKAGLCSSPTTDPGTKKECTTKSDCEGGKNCIAGTCQACGGSAGPCPCPTSAECSEGQQCVAGACSARQDACKYSSECADGKVCAEGQCLASCETTPCPSGFTCDKGVVCKPNGPAGTGCQLDSECPAETPECVAGSCVKSCTDDATCGEGKYCNQGACVVDTRPTPNCTTDAQCGGSSAPKKCLGGFCKFTCDTDQYCRTVDARLGYCAKDKVCRTAEEAAAACFGGDCPDGKSCINNQCK